VLEKTAKIIPTRAELTRRGSSRLRRGLCTHGAQRSAVREIADAAGVNVATLYIYFPSKNELHEAVLERGVRPLMDLMEEFSSGPRGIEAAGSSWERNEAPRGAAELLTTRLPPKPSRRGATSLSWLARGWSPAQPCCQGIQ